MEIKAAYFTALFALVYFGVGMFIIYFFRKRYSGRFGGQGYKFPAIIYFISIPIIIMIGTDFFSNYNADAVYNFTPSLDLQFIIGIFIFAVIPTLIYLGVGIYILSLEHLKGKKGYKGPAIIYFISVPTLIIIIITIHFMMNYTTGRFEAKNKPAGYGLYRFLVLKNIIPRSDTSLDEVKTTEKLSNDYETLDYADGKYVGQTKDGKPHGQGTITWTNGDSYNGEWQNGKRTGYGNLIFTLDNGDKYIGELYNNLWDGQGTYIYKAGDKYVGGYNNGKMEGQGTYTWVNGDKYEGQHKDGIRSGQGTYTYINGDKFVGEYKNDLMYEGTYTLIIGDTYKGFFKNGKWHGQGTYTYKSGGKYVGNWKEGHPSGQGTLVYADGKIYVGEFKKGKREGQGILTFADGRKFVGKFENDEFVEQTIIKETNIDIVNIKTDEKYYALIIGNNNYEHLEKLDAAENDAKVLASVLQDKYGFEVDLLLNADYDTTVNSLYKITNKLKSNDNLLIYYAGHGELEKAENRGYWLPVDASYELRSKWISNQRIVDRIKATKAKHVLLMVDSCFSGTLMRSGTTPEIKETIDEKYIERLKKKKTRLVITSGGEEPVVDSDGGQHSLFALKLIDTLKNNKTVINSQILFENIRRYVISNADQTPERAIVHKTGDDGGDFLFFAKN
ncbi:MAG: caspase family protein [Pelagibacterales bacterium]|nr:caspase family protein [Pelagibacterales bacterium]